MTDHSPLQPSASVPGENPALPVVSGKTPGPWMCAGCGSESVVACERTCDCPTSSLYRRVGERTVSTWKAEEVGPWRIWFDPPPIPIRAMDWHYQHKDTDLDCPAWMNGSCASREACLSEIIDGYEDRAEQARLDVLKATPASSVGMKSQSDVMHKNPNAKREERE